MTTLSPPPKFQWIDDDGSPLAFGKLYTYAAGTDTPQVSYSSATGLAQNTNPVILDAYGSCNLWLGSLLYKLVLKDSLDSTIWTVDNVGASTTDSRILATDGTAAAPAYTFLSDSDTGLYRLAANQLGFSTAGVTRGSIASTGQWLVGLSSVAYPVADALRTPLFEVVTAYADSTLIQGAAFVHFAGTGKLGTALTMARSLSDTLGTMVTVTTDTVLGSVRFDGCDGTDFSTGAAIYGRMDSDATAGEVPAGLYYYTKFPGENFTVTNETFGMTNDGRFYGRALHNNAGAVTGTTHQYVASGTYTPTISNQSGLTAISVGPLQWTRVGNVVSVAGSGTMDPNPGTNFGLSFQLSLPIASNIASSRNLGGCATSGIGEVGAGHFAGNTVNDTAECSYWITANDVNHGFALTFMYEVLA